MGIDVSTTRKVSLNEAHNNRVITNPSLNPKITQKNGLSISSIYRRTKTGTTKGDGNPLIYALKRKNGYSIETRELLKFKPSFDEILERILQKSHYDLVLGMPSSHPIVTTLSKRIARRCKAAFIDDYFVKRTVGSVLDNFDLDQITKSDLKKKAKKKIADYQKLPATSLISLKDVDIKIRRYFPPLEINNLYKDAGGGGSVIIVDDLLATGTTLLTAHKILKGKGYSCKQAICLLSDLK